MLSLLLGGVPFLSAAVVCLAMTRLLDPRAERDLPPADPPQV